LIYRPPNSGTDNTNELCSLLESAPRDAIFIGDFNAPDVNWEEERAGPRFRNLLESVQKAEMVQLVDFSTHDKGNILDLVITNCCERIINIEEAGKLGNSDHSALFVEVSVKIAQNSKSFNRLDWKRADFNAIRTVLREINWEQKLNGTVEQDWESFKNKLHECVAKFVPLRRIPKNQKPKWLSREIVKLLRRKRAAWKDYRLYGTHEHSERYKKVEKEVKVKIKKAKRKLERELARGEDKNNRKFATYIKSKTKAKTTIGPLKDNNGKITHDNQEMANILNSFFATVFTRENRNNVPEKRRETDKNLSDIVITVDLIKKKIDCLRKDSAPGPDNIHPQLMKETKNEIAHPLSIIFRKSIDTGCVPRDWKLAKITPIFKKGQKTLASNYRPVSLTSVPCKILEGLIKDEMMEHLTINRLLNSSQHGFIPGRSCATNLTVFMDKVTKIIDEGSSADIFYLDFAKAFDKVPHERLIVKLEAKGVTGKVKRWIREWLQNRSQCVVVGEKSSETCEVESGMPQGTILGPPLFTIHIDDIDIEMLLADLAVKFADDTKGVKKISSEENRKELQQVFNNLYEWSQRWGMEFNIPKCKIMHVGRGNPGYKYSIDGQELVEVDEEKDIGVIVQKNLKPGKQCEKAANMAAAVLRQIERNFHYRDKKVFVRLYKQYVLPHLEFSSPAWSPWTRMDIDKLENVQKKAVKMVAGLRGIGYEERCREIGLNTLEERRKIQDLVLLHGMINGRGGLTIENMFERANVRDGARTRQAEGANNLKIPAARTEIRRNFFTVRAVAEWNGLPDTLKRESNKEKFKREIRKLREPGGRS
jgi:hypothetical protein